MQLYYVSIMRRNFLRTLQWLSTYILLLLAHSGFAQCPAPIYFNTGETFTLTVANTVTNLKWQKDTGAGFVDIAGATAQNFIVSTEGKYRYIGKDSNGCDVELCCPQEFKLCANPTTYSLCVGESYTLTTQAGTTNIQWQKYTGTGYTNIPGATNPNYIVTTIGTYRYTAKDTNGCDIELCCPFKIIDGTNCCPNPVTYPLCAGESYTFTAQAGVINIQWQKDTGAGYIDIVAATNSTYIANNVGKYRYTGKDIAGCTIIQCCPFEIIPNPTCPIYDRGDLPDVSNSTAPNDYQTTIANNGPTHQIINGLKLGSLIDTDADGQPTPTANGDGADEDGIRGIVATMNFVPGNTLRLPLSVANTTGKTAYIEAWIDWNGDGDFADTNEQVAVLDDNTPFPSALTISIPTTAQQNQPLGFRIRLSNTANMTPYGTISSGEVEDYLITVKCQQSVCLPASYVKINTP